MKGDVEFQSLKEKWSKLKSDYYFQEYNWLKLLASCRKEGDLVFICFYLKTDLVAILPLQILKEKHFGILYTYLGFYEPDHMFIHDLAGNIDQETRFQLNDIIQALKQADIRFDYLKLKRVYNNNLSRILDTKDTFFTRNHQNIARAIICPLNYDHFLNSLSKNRRKGIKKRRRLLEKAGNIRLSISNPSNINDLLEKFLLLEKSTWKGDSGNAILNTDRQTRFFRGIVGFDESLVLLLEVDDVVVSGRICIHSNDTLFVCKTSYNEDYKRYSPGELLLLETIKYACSKKIKTINLMTDLPYHAHFSNASFTLNNHELYTKNIRCTLLVLAYKAKSTLKRLRDRILTLPLRGRRTSD